MKKLILAIVTLTAMAAMATETTIATAKKETIEYKVVKAQFAAEHVHNAGDATLTLNYAKKQVTLNIEEVNSCPAGHMCAMMMYPPVRIQLPIVSVETDSCGIRHVTAKVDQRPVDGALKQITVLDPSHISCKTLIAVLPEATYQTSYFSRMDGQEITAESKMTLAVTNGQTEVLRTSLAPAILIKFVQGSGFSPNPTTSTLYVDITGAVIKVTKQLRTGKVTRVVLAQLTHEALSNLNDQIATIPSNAKLIDQNEGEPMCMDAPTSTLSVVKKGQDVAIYQFSGCHTLNVQEGETASLYQVMMGFLDLAK